MVSWLAVVVALGGPVDDLEAAEALLQTDLMSGWAEVRRALAHHGPGAAHPDVQLDAALERTLRGAALRLHREARRQRLPELQVEALEAYTLHAATFPDSPHSPELAYAHGELLLSMSRPEGAFDRLYWAAEHGVDEAAARDWLFRALTAAEEASRQEQPRALGIATRWDEQVVACLDELRARWPGAGDPALAARAIAHLWRRGFPAEAEARTVTLLRDNPTAPEADEALHALVEAWEAEQRLGELVALDTAHLAPQTQQWLRERQVGASFSLLAHQHPQTRPSLQAAVRWEDWARAHEQHPLAADAVGRAMSHLRGIGRPARARRLQQRWRHLE